MKHIIIANEPKKNHGHGEGDCKIRIDSVPNYPNLISLSLKNMVLEVDRRELLDAVIFNALENKESIIKKIKGKK